MNYYYECEEVFSDDAMSCEFHWNIHSPDGEKIAEATTEENANLIVTMMNGDHSGK